jgi:N-acetylglutamate synthase-like GNAT family acetyltransferase
MPAVTIRLRAAEPDDAAAIRNLVRSERLNPTGLAWPNFVVAERGGEVVGAVQLRPVAPGVVELGSLVVRRAERGQGLAARLVGAVLAGAPDRVLVITAAASAGHYRRWGFRRIPARASPGPVRLNHLVGQAAVVFSLLRGRAPRRLVVLERVLTPPFAGA